MANLFANFVAGPWAGQMSISGSNFQTRNELGNYYSTVSSYFENDDGKSSHFSGYKISLKPLPGRRYRSQHHIRKLSLLIGKTE